MGLRRDGCFLAWMAPKVKFLSMKSPSQVRDSRANGSYKSKKIAISKAKS